MFGIFANFTNLMVHKKCIHVLCAGQSVQEMTALFVLQVGLEGELHLCDDTGGGTLFPVLERVQHLLRQLRLVSRLGFGVVDGD